MKYKKCAIFSGVMVLLVFLNSHKNYDFSIEGQLLDYVFSLIITYFVFLLISAIFAMAIYSFRAKKNETSSSEPRHLKVLNQECGNQVTSEVEPIQKSELPSDLMLDVQKLYDAVTQWSQYVRWLKQSTDPEMFFNTYDMFVTYANDLYNANESYRRYTGKSAIHSDSEQNIHELINGECLLDELNPFIDRSAEELVQYDYPAENDPAQKRAAARKWHDSFEPFLLRMPEEAIEHLHSKYGMLLMDIEKDDSGNL